MTTETITIGVLTLTATHVRGPMLDVLVTSQLGGHIEKLPLTIAEWTSLRATVDVLAAADREFARLRAECHERRFDPNLVKQLASAHAEIDVLKQECRELRQMVEARRG